MSKTRPFSAARSRTPMQVFFASSALRSIKRPTVDDQLETAHLARSNPVASMMAQS
jgi:hypothetical protein